MFSENDILNFATIKHSLHTLRDLLKYYVVDQSSSLSSCILVCHHCLLRYVVAYRCVAAIFSAAAHSIVALTTFISSQDFKVEGHTGDVTRRADAGVGFLVRGSAAGPLPIS